MGFKALLNYLEYVQFINGTADFVLKVNDNEVDR